MYHKNFNIHNILIKNIDRFNLNLNINEKLTYRMEKK